MVPSIYKDSYALVVNSNHSTILDPEIATWEGEYGAEVEKGVEHGRLAPRSKWTGPFFAEGFGPSLPHLSRFLKKGLFIAPF